MRDFSEIRRQLVHIGVGAFALLLRWMTWREAALMALAALAFNVVVLPRLGRRLFRPGDLDRVTRSGIALYPAAVLALILAFPTRLDIVAIAWGVLAAGDGCATLVGAHVRTAPLAWNRAKSMGGLFAFIVAGGAAGVGLAWWTAQGLAAPPPAWFRIVAPIAATVVAAFVETMPIRLNDNLSVPLTAALVAWSLGFLEPETLRRAMPALQDRVGAALLVNAAFGYAGWRTRAVTAAGAITGGVIGVVMWTALGAVGWIMLLLTFLAAAVTTRLGQQRKTLLGISEERGGRRGPGNALANTGLAAWAAIIAAGMADPTLARVAVVAALTTAGSDTVASEIGKAWGKTTWLVTSWRRVTPGTSGAVSFEGTAAAVASSAAIAGAGVLLGLVPYGALVPIVAAAVLASFAEGALGATLEAPGILNNDALNFVNTAIGAGLAVLFWLLR